VASPGHTTNPILQPKTRYDPVRDFTPLTLFADIPNILVVNPTVPARSLKELLALARKTSLTQASSGIGSPGHLVGELLQIETKVKFVHVTNKGSGAAMTDLLTGQVDLSFPTTAAALPHVKTRRLRPLGISSSKRSQTYPDVPTIAEAGVPGFEVMGWYGVLGPPRMPKEITDQARSRRGDSVAADRGRLGARGQHGGRVRNIHRVRVREVDARDQGGQFRQVAR
jgi:tripartite-type tricarboxylate transporter receptor subunit TctC